MLTPDEYFLRCVFDYPMLYASESMYISQMKVFDQLLNVIGNGIDDKEDLILELNKPKLSKEAV